MIFIVSQACLAGMLGMPSVRRQELPPPPEKKQAVEKKANVHSGTTARNSVSVYLGMISVLPRICDSPQVKRYRPSSLSGKRRREAMTVKQEATSFAISVSIT